MLIFALAHLIVLILHFYIDQNSCFNIEIEADKGSYPDSILHPPVIDDEDTEFEGLIGHFISAAEQRVWDGDEHKEVIQTHRELLEARRNTNS